MSADPIFDLAIPLQEVAAARTKSDRSRQAEAKPGAELELPSIVWTGLTQRYLDLVTPCTEAPAEFHLASMMTTVGCLIGRRSWVPMPHPTYPNFYAVLLGGTGDTRKTTAYRFSLDLLSNVSERINAKVKPLFALASVEGLAAAMKDGESPEAYRILAVEDEFKALIMKGQQKGTSNLIPRITELYNTLARFEVNTKHDRILIPDPFVSILSSSTDTWFGECIRESEVSGGFLNRWVLFKGKVDPERLIPFPEPVHPECWQKLVIDVADAITTATGIHRLSGEAKELYAEFYRLFRKRQGTGTALEATARGHVHAMKFSHVYSILAKHTQIERDDVARGIALANYCGNVAQSVAATIGQSRTAGLEQKLLAALRAGRLSSREIMRRFTWSAGELYRVQNGLHRAGLIDIITETSTAGHRRIFFESRE